MSRFPNLYTQIKQFIVSSECVTYPSRFRQKSSGYMWDGEIKVTLESGCNIEFKMWYHFHDDDGEDWRPSEQELEEAWSPSFISSENNSTSEMVDAYWHLLFFEEHVYVTKRSLTKESEKKRLIRFIKEGVERADMWLLV